MAEKKARAPKVVPECVKAALEALEKAKLQAREEGRAERAANLKTRIWKLRKALSKAEAELASLTETPATPLTDPDEVPEVEPQ